MYVGEDLLVKINPSNPLTGKNSTTATVTVNCYNPAKNPKTSAVDRANPDYTLTLTWDPTLRAFYGSTNTTGWRAGTWTLLIDSTGDLTGHTYRTITLTDG